MRRRCPPAARALCALALLVGLIGMHGLASPSSCHSGGDMTSPLSTVSRAMVPSPTGIVTDAAPSMTPTLGDVCVAVAPQTLSGPIAVLALVAVVALGAGSWAGSTRASRARRDGGPPPAGVALLHRVCVSRT